MQIFYLLNDKDVSSERFTVRPLVSDQDPPTLSADVVSQALTTLQQHSSAALASTSVKTSTDNTQANSRYLGLTTDMFTDVDAQSESMRGYT